MIKPLKPCKESKATFVACDIENNPDGSVICIDTCWRENGEPTHVLHRKWETWIDWLVKNASIDKRFRKVYAHNGGGWDWLSLVHYLVFERKKHSIRLHCSTANSTMVTLTLRVYEGDKVKLTIRLCDSMQLLRSSLDELGKKFVGKGKVDLGDKLPHEILAQNPELFWSYVRQDTETLLYVLENALELLREHVAKIDDFGVTIGSTGLKVFKTIGLNREISIPTDETVKEFLRSGYRGGRVELFKPGIYKNLTVYDINSLYPYAMKTVKVPTSARGVWTNNYTKGLVGCFHITFNQTRRDILPILMVNGKGEYKGDGVYFSPEIDLFHDLKAGEIEIRTGYVFVDTDYLFNDFVDSLYKLRLEHKGGPVDLLAKYLLNSCYGKFGQHSERESIVANTPDVYELVKSGKAIAEPIVYGREDILRVTENVDCDFEHVGIAGMITSRSRVVLYAGLLATGKDDVIYCDTDSVHTVGTLDSGMVGKEIGKFKVEYIGKGVYCGKKLYALSNGKTEKIRAKGVSVKQRDENGNVVACKYGSELTYNHFVSMAKGKVIPCEFSRPATLIEVITGKRKPCSIPRIPNRKRRLKRIG